MSTTTLKPTTRPTAPVTRHLKMPLESIHKTIERIAHKPSTLRFEVEDNGTNISLYFEENNGFFAIPTAYLYVMQIA